MPRILPRLKHFLGIPRALESPIPCPWAAGAEAPVVPPGDAAAAPPVEAPTARRLSRAIKPKVLYSDDAPACFTQANPAAAAVGQVRGRRPTHRPRLPRPHPAALGRRLRLEGASGCTGKRRGSGSPAP